MGGRLLGSKGGAGMNRIGRTTSPVERAGQLRRGRVLSATAEIVRECGHESLTVTQLVSRAGVSTRAFNQLFDDPRECVMAAFDDAVATISARARHAYHAQNGWVEQICAGLAAMLEFFDERPEFAWLCLVHAPTDEPQLVPRCRELTSALADMLDEAAPAGPSRASPPWTSHNVVAGVLSAIRARVVDGLEPLSPMLPSLMATIVLPYLGPDAAQQQLTRPAAASVASCTNPARPPTASGPNCPS